MSGKEQYVATPSAMIWMLQNNPLADYTYSGTHKVYYINTDDVADAFTLQMAGAALYNHNNQIRIGVVLDAVAKWKDITDEELRDLEHFRKEANAIRRKHNRLEVKKYGSK